MLGLIWPLLFSLHIHTIYKVHERGLMGRIYKQVVLYCYQIGLSRSQNNRVNADRINHDFLSGTF
jgi:hypothetical protein